MGATTTIFWLYLAHHVIPSSIFWPLFVIGFVALWVHSSTGMSLRRKTAISTWEPTTSGPIFAKQSVDMTNALAYVNKMREKNGSKVTVTHLVGKAVALALRKVSCLNGRLLFGKFIQNDTVDVCFLVATGGGKNLAPKTLRNVDKKSVQEICDELSSEVTKVREGKDEEFKKNMQLVAALPTFVLTIISKFVGFISGDLGLGISAIGLKPRNFGSCLITNVGVFGVEEAYAPFTPFAKVPLLVLVGAVADKACVRDGQVVILPIMKLMATLDHRFIDGADGTQLAKHAKELLENPERLDKEE
jgi:pyruvate dehydrogenase E2 component (dihydrolipoamide acetyltransferase)